MKRYEVFAGSRKAGRGNGMSKACIDDLGGIAQLGEHLLCKQGVVGSSPTISTSPTRGIIPRPCPSERKFARKRRCSEMNEFYRLRQNE